MRPHPFVIVDNDLELRKCVRDICISSSNPAFIDVEQEILQSATLFLSDFKQDLPASSKRISMQRLSTWHVQYGVGVADDKMFHALRAYVDYSVYIVCVNEGQLQRTKEILEEKHIEIERFQFFVGSLSTGFVLPQRKILFITDNEIFGRVRVRAPKVRMVHSEPIRTYHELVEGELVVHLRHGIGRFCGVVVKTFDKVEGEYMVIEYQDRAKLYVPLDQIETRI